MAWYPPTVTVAAASEPITLTEAKAQCRVEGTDSDAELAVFIAAARDHVERYCGTPLIIRTVTVKCDCFDDFAAFPVVPLGTVTGVSYVDSDGATQTLSTDVYEVRTDGRVASLVLKSDQSWPSIETGSRITVTATVGYAALPDAIRAALLLLVGQWFDQRADIADRAMPAIPNGVEALLTNHRFFAF